MNKTESKFSLLILLGKHVGSVRLQIYRGFIYQYVILVNVFLVLFAPVYQRKPCNLSYAEKLLRTIYVLIAARDLVKPWTSET